MVEFTEKLIKKMVLMTMVVFFILSFVFFNLYLRNQQERKNIKMVQYSIDTISYMFSQDEIDQLIRGDYDFKKKFFLEKINLILKRISHELHLHEKDIFIVRKDKKQYLKVFVIDRAPNLKGMEKVREVNKYLFKKFKNADNKDTEYYIFIRKIGKREKILFSSLFFSIIIVLIFLLSFLIIKKMFDKDIAFYNKIEEIIDKRDDENMILVKEDDLKFIVKIKEIIAGLYLIKKRIYKSVYSLKEIDKEQVVIMLNSLKKEILEKKNREEEIDFYLKKIGSIEKENKELIKAMEINNSREKVEEFLTGIKTVNDFIQKIESDLSLINSNFLKTMELMVSIEELAERSHLLSINATIEASSENENKRFSIVASEIRKLSKESKEITNKIKADFSYLKELIGEKAIEDIKNTKKIMDELIVFEEFFNGYFDKQINITDNIKANANDSGLISKKVLTSLNLILENIPRQEKTMNEIYSVINLYIKYYEIIKSDLEQTKKMIDGVLKNEKI